MKNLKKCWNKRLLKKSRKPEKVIMTVKREKMKVHRVTHLPLKNQIIRINLQVVIQNEYGFIHNFITFLIF